MINCNFTETRISSPKTHCFAIKEICYLVSPSFPTIQMYYLLLISQVAQMSMLPSSTYTLGLMNGG